MAGTRRRPIKLRGRCQSRIYDAFYRVAFARVAVSQKIIIITTDPNCVEKRVPTEKNGDFDRCDPRAKRNAYPTVLLTRIHRARTEDDRATLLFCDIALRIFFDARELRLRQRSTVHTIPYYAPDQLPGGRSRKQRLRYTLTAFYLIITIISCPAIDVDFHFSGALHCRDHSSASARQ